MGVCWTMVWWRIAAETPASAPRCSAAERAYIEHALAIEQAATKKAEAAEAQVIRHIGAEGLNRRPPAGCCRLFLGPGFRLAAR